MAAHGGAGLGREVARAGEAWLVERGIRTVQPMVRDGNPAVEVSEHLGHERQHVAVLGRWLER